MRIRWMDGIKLTLAGLFLFVVFLLLTFPFPRLKPIVVKEMQRAIQGFAGTSISCDLQGFNFHFPLGVKWSRLQCIDPRGQNFLELNDVTLITLPKYQSLKGSIGSGTLDVTTNAGLGSAPSQLTARINQVPLESLSSLISNMITKANPMVRDLQFAGSLTGSVELPLTDYRIRPGSLQVEIKGFKLPPQSNLKMIGLVQGLDFSKSVVKANLSGGKLTISEAAFLSDHISGKAEGSIDLAETLNQSAGNLTLKWQVKRSDAIMSAPLGMAIASAPCPNPDSEGFCTRKISRFSDLTKAP